MMRAIKVCKPGRSINVIGRIIESYASRFEYGVVPGFHRSRRRRGFHSGLVIPHYDSPRYDTIMEEGMVFTIEP
ncbi:M24 family metallopeptidase, partial [Mobiluncus curtisii]|uniref:M24 family metallopeptidase n=1 Tax=Mobiluncus curtisii TaxID=2051 RepID=UPI00209286DE